MKDIKLAKDIQRLLQNALVTADYPIWPHVDILEYFDLKTLEKKVKLGLTLSITLQIRVWFL